MKAVMAKLTLVCVSIIAISLMFAFVNWAIAIEVIDEFSNPNLDSKLWIMKKVGKASFEIKGGFLTMTSPDVASGIILYHPRNIEDMDITFEVKLDNSAMGENISCGSIAEVMDPQLNDNINNNWEATFFFLPDGTCYIKQDPLVIGQKPPNPAGMTGVTVKGWNVLQAIFSESKGKVTFILNNKEIGTVDKLKDVKQRYFYVSCDLYDSHYTGTVTVDYIKISGPGASSLAVVDQKNKLATTWASIKTQ